MSGPIEVAKTPCEQCPLLGCSGLRPLDGAQLHYMNAFKSGEIAAVRGDAILSQGALSGQLFTLLQGVAIRYKLLDDGRRQILNFMFPGDLIGLQAALQEPVNHTIEMLTNGRLCRFDRERFVQLIESHPQLAFDITWLAAREERALEDHIVALGQRSARERVLYLALFLMERGLQTCLVDGDTLQLPITQSQIGDMLGLSLVHTNRTLQSLRRDGLLKWTLTELSIPDIARAKEFCGFDIAETRPRPYI